MTRPRRTIIRLSVCPFVRSSLFLLFACRGQTAAELCEHCIRCLSFRFIVHEKAYISLCSPPPSSLSLHWSFARRMAVQPDEKDQVFSSLIRFFIELDSDRMDSLVYFLDCGAGGSSTELPQEDAGTSHATLQRSTKLHRMGGRNANRAARLRFRNANILFSLRK